MKPIKITPKNREKIEAALKAVNGRAESFTVQYLHQVQNFVDDAEAQLAPLPKKDRVGVVAHCSLNGPAKAYKYGAKSTSVLIELRATGWFLKHVAEYTIHPAQSQCVVVTISAEQRDEIMRRSVAKFRVRSDEPAASA